MGDPRTVGDAALDLVRGSTCLDCQRPGPMLCRPCAARLPMRGHLVPSPGALGDLPVYASLDYLGLARDLVVVHKERRGRELRPVLGRLLAAALAQAIDDLPGVVDDVTLVPVPSRPGVARRRGEDPTGGLLRHAARRLASGSPAGLGVRVAPLLVSARGVADQAGLDRARRSANLAGSMHSPAHLVARLARRTPRTTLLVCDDVVTTGATLGESRRALAASGLRASAAAVVAATPAPGGPRGSGSDHFLLPPPPTG